MLTFAIVRHVPALLAGVGLAVHAASAAAQVPYDLTSAYTTQDLRQAEDAARSDLTRVTGRIGTAERQLDVDALPRLTSWVPKDAPAPAPRIVCVEVEPTLTRLRQAHDDAMRSFDGLPEWAALRSYVAAQFPTPADLPIVSLPQRPPAAPLQGIELTRAQNAFDRARALLTKVRSLAPLALSIAVTSMPDRATVRIEPFDGGNEKAALTIGSLVLRRGLYKYRVEKTGMKPMTGSLDLVDDTRLTLSCHMVPDSSPQTSVCNREP